MTRTISIAVSLIAIVTATLAATVLAAGAGHSVGPSRACIPEATKLGPIRETLSKEQLANQRVTVIQTMVVGAGVHPVGELTPVRFDGSEGCGIGQEWELKLSDGSTLGLETQPISYGLAKLTDGTGRTGIKFVYGE